MYKNPKTKILLKSMFLTLIVSLSINALAVWAPPTSAPTDPGNTPAPVNVGSALQFKNGSLKVLGFRVEGGANAYFDGNVAIGNLAPTQKLDVTGSVKFSGSLMPAGSAGTLGQVLISAGPGATPYWGPATGGGAPTNATYVTNTPDSTLTNEQALSTLSTGILKNTTGTGTLSIAVPADFPILNQNTTGNAATATALAANPADCNAGSYARGINASGAAEGCTAVVNGVTDHGALTGLTDDDHPQYALLAGRGFGQTLIGGHSTATGVLTLVGGAFPSADLNLKTTSAAGITGADMHFLVGNNGATEAMTILNNGNVGIGDISPSAKLEITGASNTSGLRFTNLTSSSPAATAGTKVLSVNSSGDVVLVTDATGASGVNTVGTINSQTPKSDDALKINGTSIYAQTADASFPGMVSISAQTFSGVKTFSGATSNNIVVNAGAGDAFVNLNSVNGDSWSLLSNGISNIGKFSVYDVDDAINRLVIDTDGDIGIGTNTPGAKFDVVGSGRFTADSLGGGTGLNIQSNSAGVTGQKGLSVTLYGTNTATNQKTMAGYFENSHTLTNAGLSMTNAGIQAIATGNGIGTITTIAGEFSATGGTSNYAIIVPANEGFVGIGTSNPIALLDVAGTAKVGGVQYVPVAGKPTCNVSNRGLTWFTQSSSGVKDIFEVCAKDASNIYAWRQLY